MSLIPFPHPHTFFPMPHKASEENWSIHIQNPKKVERWSSLLIIRDETIDDFLFFFFSFFKSSKTRDSFTSCHKESVGHAGGCKWQTESVCTLYRQSRLTCCLGLLAMWCLALNVNYSSLFTPQPSPTHTHTHTHTHTAALSAAYLYLYCSGGGDTRCLPVLDVQSTGGPSPGISPLGLCGELIHACECAART